MSGKIVFSIILFAIFFSCSTTNDAIVEKRQNVLTYEDKYGIVSYIKADKNNFSLNDTVRISLLTINNSDTHKVHIYSTYGPLWHYDVFNEGMEPIASLPGWATPTIYDFYFSPGDTFKSTLDWTQTMHSNDQYSDLKVFSGDYYITGNQPGLPGGKVGIWIHISEDGEALTTKLNWHYSERDSIKLDFLIRNRISKGLVFNINKKSSPKIQFFNSLSNTLIKEINIGLNISKIELTPKSDLKILTFKESNSTLKNMGLSGSYNCRIVIPCEERDIIAKSAIVIN